MISLEYGSVGNILAVQMLGLHDLTAEGPGSIPGQGTKIPQAACLGQKKKEKKRKACCSVKL